MRPEETTSTSAKILYRPFGITISIGAGLVAGRIFQEVWKRGTAGPDGDAPKAKESEYTMQQVLIAAAIHGAIFASVKALADRAGARAFQRWTGEWPGD